jgi:hypothetical protein
MTINTNQIGDQPFNAGFRSVLGFVGNERSLRRAFWNRRRERVRDLFDGGTSEAEERIALSVLLRADSGAECRHYIRAFTWDRFDDELVEQQVTEWAQHIGIQHAQDAHLVARWVRWSVGSTSNVPLEDQVARYQRVWGGLSVRRRQDLASWLVGNRATLISAGVRMELVGRPNQLASFRSLVEIAASDPAVGNDDLRFLQWQAFYAPRFAEQLRDGQVRLLATTLLDLVNPDLPNVRRRALFDLYQGLFDRTFRALREVIESLGNAEAQQRFQRFMEARRVFIDSFPETQPTPAIIGEVARAIGAVAASLDGIAATLADVGERVGGINIDSLLNETEDDDARATINELGRAGLLDALPLNMRVELCRRCLEGFTDSDDEQAIHRVIQNTWPASLCERYLLVSALTWDALSYSFDGDETDNLEALLSNV